MGKGGKTEQTCQAKNKIHLIKTLEASEKKYVIGSIYVANLQF